MATEATERPWRKKQTEHDEFQVLNFDQIVAVLHDPYAFDAGVMGEIEANADLIVRAVNAHDKMLVALELTADFMGEMGGPRTILQAVQTAIALAKGAPDGPC